VSTSAAGEGPFLHDDHRRTLVDESAIAPEIIKERGYFTVTKKQQAIALGFGPTQARPGLVFPIHGLSREPVGRQLRPDEPREKDGKLVKYETPRGARAVPDIHPRMQPKLADWKVRLWITEGIKKGDSAATRGLACVAFTGGVWGFRNKGGVHSELKDLVTWQGPQGERRQVVIAFDSDITTKVGVHDAAERLAAVITSRGATARFLILPPGKDGKKQGLDDYFAAGGTLESLERLIVEKLPPCEKKAGEHAHPESGGSMSDQLVAIVRDNPDIELFHAPGDQEHGYATVTEGDQTSSFDIEGASFSSWLTKACLETQGRAPTKDVLATAINSLKAIALHQGGEHPVSLRVGGYDGDWYLDLGDESWQVVRITNGTWESVRKSPVRFIRSAAMRPLPPPSMGGNINDLWTLVNIPDPDHQKLFLCWLVAALCPSGPYAILMLHGQQGSAKSFTTAIARQLIDPNQANLRRPHKCEEDLMVSAGCNYVLAFENLSSLPDWMSDAFCALSTGSGFATRKLYTNKDESVLQACRPIILNGIPALGTRGDFVERCVSLQLPPISAENRKSSEELEREFARMHPTLQGALLDITAKAVQLLPSIKLAEMPRMADFARLGVAVERVCKWPDGSFLRAYAENAKGMNLLALESGLGGLLVPLVESELAVREPDSIWDVSMKQLLQRLRGSVNDDRDLKRFLPAYERNLRTGLDRLAPSLRSAGIHVTFPGRTRDGAQVRFARTTEPRDQSQRDITELKSEKEEEPSAAHSEDVSQFLCRLHNRHGVLLRLGVNMQSVEIVGVLTEDLKAEAASRTVEILRHLRSSPGSHIVDYPDEERLHPYGFQEFRIDERTRMRRIAEVERGGVPRLTWFPEVSPARMREIAAELEVVAEEKRRQLGSPAKPLPYRDDPA
jgi:hypothetical protein